MDKQELLNTIEQKITASSKKTISKIESQLKEIQDELEAYLTNVEEVKAVFAAKEAQEELVKINAMNITTEQKAKKRLAVLNRLTAAGVVKW